MVTFKQAAKLQYRQHSYYTIWIVSPTGEREYVGFTARKSGAALINIITTSQDIKDKLSKVVDMDGTFKKTKDAVVFSCGWKVAFGRTIREEASIEELAK